MAMTSSRPYIIRALYEWILENECTPYLLVNAMDEHVEVPQQFVKNGQIVLNISPVAVMDLLITNDSIHFSGRFSGVPQDIFAPMSAVMGIYARENGQGMIFDMDEEPTPEPPKPDKKVESIKGDAKPDATKGPGLRVVK